jgi:hypothetical protein
MVLVGKPEEKGSLRGTGVEVKSIIKNSQTKVM